MDEVGLLLPEFPQFLVAQSTVQIQHEGGIYVLAPQLCRFGQHARLFIGRICPPGDAGIASFNAVSRRTFARWTSAPPSLPVE
jgi:hypothetical protein